MVLVVAVILLTIIPVSVGETVASSKNVLDAIELTKEDYAMIPSRRQSSANATLSLRLVR